MFSFVHGVSTDVKEMSNFFPICFQYMCSCRLPPLPLSCYHGNVFAESVKVWRVNGYTKGLDLSLLCEGPGHAEGEMEILHRQAVVKFGDNCQVGNCL